MKSLSTKQTGTTKKADGPISNAPPTPRTKGPGKDIVDTLKHAAHVVAKDAVTIGKDIKTASTEFMGKAIKGSKDAYTSSEKAVLTATEKTLKASAHAASKAEKSIHKTNHSKQEKK